MNVPFAKASALIALLAATTVWAQAPETQGSAGATAQGSASAQASSASRNSRAGAQATGTGSAQTTAAASGSSGEAGSALAAGSSVNAVLSRPVDPERSKPGDPVSARTTQTAKTEDGIVIPSGSQLVGHLAQPEPNAGGTAGAVAGSSVALVFDRVVLQDGRHVPLRHVSIRALAAAESGAAAGVGDGRAMMGGSGAMAGGGRAGLGSGLIGRTGGAVGGTVGGAAGGAGSIGGSGMRALQPGPGASGGLDASGLLKAQSVGVFGLRGVSLGTEDFALATESVVASSSKRLRLDEGT
ncbi:MAG: hypothetical protein JO347_11095, partial [Candidatus Eremiobacteraeota bacterium]|nr:hypothetical protein [Candidatus Eremiobacteraeota bacterium]